MLKQVSVFLQNEPGRLSALCRAIADEKINMHSLLLADTESFGIVRIFCDYPARAAKTLQEKGFRAATISVAAVRISNDPGSLVTLMDFLGKRAINVEYSYCFTSGDAGAIGILKTDEADIDSLLEKAGFQLAEASTFYQDDEA